MRLCDAPFGAWTSRREELFDERGGAGGGHGGRTNAHHRWAGGLHPGTIDRASLHFESTLKALGIVLPTMPGYNQGGGQGALIRPPPAPIFTAETNIL